MWSWSFWMKKWFWNTSQNITEMSHRSKEFDDILNKTKSLFRELL
jgi:phosphoserine aminotransferase